MNTKQLTKNIVKPFFINDIKISKIASNAIINLDNFFNDIIICFSKIYLKSKTSNLNDVNILELITWIESFQYLKIINWDDDKEFDFSNIENIELIIKFDYNNYLINEKQFDNIKILEMNKNIKNLIGLKESDQINNFFNNFIFEYFNDAKIFN